jgi:uncharacterized repeat protein (TIGR03803 family)
LAVIASELPQFVAICNPRLIVLGGADMNPKLFRKMVGTIASFLVVLALVSTTQASTEKILYSFAGGVDGESPEAGVIFDTAGNLYGTTWGGGGAGHGTVFKLSRNPDGTWTESILHSFQAGTDGEAPRAELVFDKAGNLYGTTFSGGTVGGVVFELSPNTDGTWTETIIHNFNGVDGAIPTGALIMDGAGNFYGTTAQGGTLGGGTVFQLVPNVDGSWAESVLYNFPIGSAGTTSPSGTLTFDSLGNLYGTTQSGGSGAIGNAYKLSPSGGYWTITNLHSFTGAPDGTDPDTGVIFDAAGNLYGTTLHGGVPGCAYCGTVFRLSPAGGRGWTEKVMRVFTGGPGESNCPTTGLVLDSANNAYGTTYLTGSWIAGMVFKVNLSNGKMTVLQNFDTKGFRTGQGPSGKLVLDSAGNLYGTTIGGGASGVGEVFEIIP